MGLQFFVTAIGVIVFQKALNAFGSVAIAGFSAAIKVENLVSTTFFALGSSMAVFAGQNIGANRPDRVKKGVRITFVVGAVKSVVAGVLMVAFGRSIITLFVSKDVTQDVFSYGMTFIRIVAPTFLLISLSCTATLSKVLDMASSHSSEEFLSVYPGLPAQVLSQAISDLPEFACWNLSPGF